MYCLRPFSAAGRIRQEQILVTRARSNDEDRSNLWDSNAENVRSSRSRLKLKTSNERSKSRGAFQVEDEADYVRSSSSGRFQYKGYEDEDDYASYYEDEQDEDFFDWKMVLGILGVPLAFVGIPWLIEHPVVVTMALAVVPLAQRAFSLWSSISRRSRGRPSESRSRKRYYGDYGRAQSDEDGDTDEEEEEEELYDSSWENSKARDVESDRNKNKSRKAAAGWYELEQDRSMLMKRSRSGRARLNRFRARKKLPVFWRILLSLFPFLRSWGGFV